MDLKELIQEYFTSCKAMQLATVSEGQPWLCTVYFVTDEDFNVYWTSAKMRRHSKELLNHPAVAVAIVKDSERKQALQITGQAAMVDLADAERVNQLYGAKYGNKPERLEEVMANTPNGRAYWVLKPTSISLWDEVNFPDQPKREFKLP
jgi:uncharacterized protein YhbP (UPF0306 family)